jgi:hypothetical protein
MQRGGVYASKQVRSSISSIMLGEARDSASWRLFVKVPHRRRPEYGKLQTHTMTVQPHQYIQFQGLKGTELYKPRASRAAAGIRNVSQFPA